MVCVLILSLWDHTGNFIEFIKLFALTFSRSTTQTIHSQDRSPPNDSLSFPLIKPQKLGEPSQSPEKKSGDGESMLRPEDVQTPPLYFQSWQVNVMELKIDYSPNQVCHIMIWLFTLFQLNLEALQGGDYTQLLNLFSIDGLEITLTRVRLSGVSGVSAGVQKCLEEWVNEIYAHQMHRYWQRLMLINSSIRLISGTSPLRGISNIGANVHGLLMIPVQEYKKNGAVGVLRSLRKESVSLFQTITRETLHASHLVWLFHHTLFC